MRAINHCEFVEIIQMGKVLDQQSDSINRGLKIWQMMKMIWLQNEIKEPLRCKSTIRSFGSNNHKFNYFELY